MKDAELAQELHLRDLAEPAADRLLTRINAPLARLRSKRAKRIHAA